MTTVVHHVLDLDGTPMVGHTVTITLMLRLDVAPDSYDLNSPEPFVGAPISRFVSAISDSNGQLSWDLVPNDQIVPAGTYYEVHGLGGGRTFLYVPASDVGVELSECVLTLVDLGGSNLVLVQGPRGRQGGDSTGGVGVPIASPTQKGILQLTGDLGGTADEPTVVSGVNHGHTSAQIVDATDLGTPGTVIRRDENGDFFAAGVHFSGVDNNGIREPRVFNPDTSQGAAFRIGNPNGDIRFLPYGDGTTYIQITQDALAFTGVNAAQGSGLSFNFLTTTFTGTVNSGSSADPTSDTQLAPKAYVDRAILTRVGIGGDIGGTPAEPTVPGLANKANTVHSHSVADLTATGTRDSTKFLRGDNVWATPPGQAATTPILVLGASDPVPAGTQAGTLIIRTSGGVASGPSALTLTATPGDGQVTISASGATGATSYALYRGTTATGTPIATSFPFTDTGRTNGTAYSYVATASNAQGTVTSAVVSATPTAASARPQLIQSSASSAWSASAASLVINKPAGVVDGDLLVAVVHNQNGPTTMDETAPLPLPVGWQMLSNLQAPQNMRATVIAGLPVPSASALTATSWTFNFGVGAGRMVGTIFRVTGVNLSSPTVAHSVDGADSDPFTMPAYNLDVANGLTIFEGHLQVVSPYAGVPATVVGATPVIEIESSGATDDTTVTRSVLTICIATPTDSGTTKTQPSITYTEPGGSSASSRGGQAVTLRSVSSPAAPAAIALTATPASGQVTLAMTGGSGATSYALYRGTTPTGSPIATSLPFTDTGLTNGTQYNYVVTGTGPGGTTTSNVVTVTPSAGAGATVTAVSVVAKLDPAGLKTNGGTITVPAGVTASHVGIICIADANGYSNGEVYNIADNGGGVAWTTLTSNNPAFNNSAVAMFKKIGGKAGDVITITETGTVTTSSAAVYAVWLNTQGQDVAITGTVGGRSGVSSPVTVIPAITTTKLNQIVLVLASERTTATGTVVSSSTPPVTQDYFFEDTAGSATSFYVGHFVQGSPQTTGAVDLTYSGGSGNGAGLLLALP